MTAVVGGEPRPRGDTPRVAGEVAATLFAGLRRHLVDDGRWARVRDLVVARDASAVEWIDASVPSDWVSVEHHVAVLRGLEDVSGIASLREMGRERSRAVSVSGGLAPILRGWMRNYAQAPEHFVRVSPHVWSAATRGLGRLIRVPAPPSADRGGYQQFRTEGLPKSILEAKPWHALLEGFGDGLIELAGREGRAALIPAASHPGEMEMTFRWS